MIMRTKGAVTEASPMAKEERREKREEKPAPAAAASEE